MTKTISGALIPRKFKGYGECKCILSKYCDGTCNPIYEDRTEAEKAEWLAKHGRLTPVEQEGQEARPINPNLGDGYEPCMDINAKPGTVVRFRAGGGYEWEKKRAIEAGFVLNALYTVKRCDIGRSMTEVLIDGMEGRWNSCLFSDATQPRTLVLSGYQLREAMTFIAPDGTDEQMEQEVCIAMRPAGVDMDGEHYEAGLCCWIQEYPEEGSIPLDGKCNFAAMFTILRGTCSITGPREDVLHISKLIGDVDDTTTTQSEALPDLESLETGEGDAR